MNPYSLLPLAIAAQDGRVDDFETQQLVAAGLTLLQRSVAIVRALSGKRSAILLPTSPAFVVALAASEGRAAVLINPLASPSEISYQLTDANVGAVFTTSALAARVPDSVVRVLLDDAPRTARVLADGASRDVDLGSHVGLSVEGSSDEPGSDEDFVIVYTSAMAGEPLGAILTHRNLLANARAAIDAIGNDANDRVLALLPFSHLFGLTVTGHAPLLAGGRVITMPKFSATRVVERLAAGEVTEIVGVPAIFRAVLAAVERRGGSLPTDRLRVCLCGGAPLGVELQDRWAERTGVELRQGYGLTEASPVCLFNRIDRPNVRGSLGVPFPGVDVELRAPILFDEAGCAQSTSDSEPAFDEGEICVRGANVFRGYVGDRSTGLVVRDGWLHTGDLGRRSGDGTIAFSGLVKPMFTRNGFNIYPREIERVVRLMPGVERATVREGASVASSMDREPDIALEVRGSVSEDAVREWCAESLAAYKQPTLIRVR